jgi:GTP-binding protein HflX
MATLVGYTNAGKSTLFNALSNADVPAEDQLFNTLDPVTRRIELPNGGGLLLSDTVGFIQKLSPMVVAAFRATLEEVHEADLLLHVIDITHPKAPEQAEVVEQTLANLELGGKPRLLVINKMDLLTDDLHNVSPDTLAALPDIEAADSPAVSGRVFVSAMKGWNLDSLLTAVQEQVGKPVPSPDKAAV